MAICDFDNRLEYLAYGASDFILMPSSFEPCGLPQMIAPLYGSLPIVHDTGGIHDTIRDLDVENNSGNGFLFVSYDGEIFPSGFLPLACGNVKTDSVTEVYRNHKVFWELRNPDLLKGKCGICEYRYICGGSRARAFAMTGDYLEDEPFCAYIPQGDPVISPSRPA